jgi:microcystin degradation protein MlrC
MSSDAQTRRPLVAIGSIMHESNSFNPAKTTVKDYHVEERPAPDLLERWSRSNSEVAGYIEGGQKAGIDLYPTVYANATPKGPLTDETFNNLVARLVNHLKDAPKLDGVLLALHGAMVVDSHPHGDAEIVRRVREAIGPAMPLIVTHDFHANVSPEIVKLSTVLITYKQNPHLDTKDRGIQAATLMGRILRREIKPVQTVVKPPMVYNIVFQNTYAPPLLPITQESMRLEKENPKILAVSVSGGYQYADVAYMGPSVIVATDNDPALAEREAKRLSDMLWANREEIRLRLPDAAAAVKDAMTASKFPVALFDMGDNIGGGSAGDSTFLLDELVRQNATGWVVVIADPAAVDAAVKAGIGGTFDMAVGGKTDKMHGSPVRVRGRVKSLHDGKYIETAVRHGGGRYHEMGLTAVIEADGSTRDLANILVVTTRRSSPNSLHQLINVGVYPERQRILTVKGTIAPRAAYEPVAARIVPVDTPGATAVNPARYKFTRVRERLFGID